jgi:hypothetical protein
MIEPAEPGIGRTNDAGGGSAETGKTMAKAPVAPAMPAARTERGSRCEWDEQLRRLVLSWSLGKVDLAKSAKQAIKARPISG